MKTLEIGNALVALCREDKAEDAMNTFYADDIVSIEGAKGPKASIRTEGLEAVREKTRQWLEATEVHALGVEGPFVAEDSDQFSCIFDIDITDKASGQRIQMREIALYTVRGDKIVEEQFFFPPMPGMGEAAG